jgi:hypothetical protein
MRRRNILSDTLPVPPPQPPPPPPAPNPLDQLNTWAQSIGAAEKAQGSAAAIRKISEDLGMSPEEAKAFIEEQKAKEREGLSEAERKLAEATEKEAAASRREEAASQRELNSEVRAQLVELGMTRAQAAQVVGLVQVDVKDWDEAKVTAAIEAVKTTFPALFPQEEEHPSGDPPKPPASSAPKPPHSAPAATPPATPPGGQSSQDKAREMLLRRHPDKVKSQS